MIDIPSNVDKLKELAQSLKNQYGIEVRYYMADNSKEADIQKVSEQIIQDFGHIDGLINAAVSISMAAFKIIPVKIMQD